MRFAVKNYTGRGPLCICWSGSTKGEDSDHHYFFNIRASNVFGVDNAVLPVWRDTYIAYHAGCLMDRSGKCDDEDSFEKDVERESA